MDLRVNKQYKCLPFLVMLLTTLSILVHILQYKKIWTNTIDVTFFIGPFWFLLNDIIAEVYGYKISIKIFWYNYISQNIFLAIYYVLTNFHSPDLFTQSSFSILIYKSWDDFLVNPIALFIAWKINARFLLKWKILMKGKYFWLRSIGSSGIAEVLFPIILIPEALLFWDIHYILHFVFWLCIFRLFVTTLFSFPASLIANILKAIENYNVQKNQINFNPFKQEKSAET